MTEHEDTLADRRTFLAGGLLALTLPVTAAAEEEERKTGASTVIMVRHAEKEAEGDDPALTPAGSERALALAALLENTGVTHLLATEYRRCHDTLAPLAEKCGVKIEKIPAHDNFAWVERLIALPPGSVAVYSGHTHTIPALIKELGREIGDLDERGRIQKKDHDRLFVVTLSDVQALTLLELRYGERD